MGEWVSTHARRFCGFLVSWFVGAVRAVDAVDNGDFVNAVFILF